MDKSFLSHEEVHKQLEESKSPSTLITSIHDLQIMLIEREERIQQYRGIFAQDAQRISFFHDPKGEEHLAEIKKRNSDLAVEPVTIGDLLLINYSYCPECGKIYSWHELNEYYAHPHIPKGMNSRTIIRKDSRVHCSVCQTAFLPSLLLERNEPHSEFQYLGKVQLIEAIEKFMYKPVLSKVQENIVYNGKTKEPIGIQQDVTIIDLREDKCLLTNLLQHSPYEQILKMLRNEYEGMLILGGF